MSSGSTRKMVAAVSAVMQYLHEEEGSQLQPAVAPASPPPFSPWNLAGRQDAMLFRTLWQRRLGRCC